MNRKSLVLNSNLELKSNLVLKSYWALMNDGENTYTDLVNFRIFKNNTFKYSVQHEYFEGIIVKTNDPKVFLLKAGKNGEGAVYKLELDGPYAIKIYNGKGVVKFIKVTAPEQYIENGKKLEEKKKEKKKKKKNQ